MSKPIRLTVAQRAIWLAHHLDQSQSAYNIAQLTRIDGRFDPRLFEEVAASVARDAQALHLRVRIIDDEPCFSIIDNLDLNLHRVDVSAEAAPLQSAMASMERARKLPFDLSSEPLFRWHLYKLSDDSWIWFQCYHHLIVDGWSVILLERYAAARYSELLHGQAVTTIAIPPLTTEKDEAAYRASRSFRADRDYWLASWSDATKFSSLSDVSAITIPNSYRCQLDVPAPLAAKIERFAWDNGLSKAQVYIAVSAIYVARMSQQSDVVLGVPVVARVGRRERSAIDMRSNIVHVRLQIPATTTVSDVVALAGAQLRSVFRHQNYRYEDLRSDLGLIGHDGDLFGLSVNLLTFDGARRFGSAQANTQILWSGPTRDLALTISDTAGGIQLYLDGNAQRYDERELQVRLSRWALLLETICDADSQTSIASIPMLSPAETNLVLHGFNATSVTSGDDLLPSQFETQVARTPETTALICGSERMSYAELNVRINRLAHALMLRGVGPEHIVGIALERSHELIVALLAVLKTGAAYLPLDPGYPKERLALMAQDARVQMILSDQSLADRLPPSCNTLWLDATNTTAALQTMPQANPTDQDRIQPLRPGNIAYVIYTSGSTGTPKGVAVTHNGLKNYLAWADSIYNRSERMGTALTLDVGFDASITCLFVPLISGSFIEIVSKNDQLKSLGLERRFDFIKYTPSHLRLIKGQPNPHIRDFTACLILGGEPLGFEQVKWWLDQDPRTKIINEYGPTETVVGCTYFEVDRTDENLASLSSVPIGRPIWNTRVYVLDKALEPVGIGVAGELFISGAGLARGYLGRPGLTSERFIADPFGEPGARMYRTGDLARWRPDGVLDFLGRIDEQVKIRGFRIEPGEIEAALCAHPSVTSAAVIAREDEPGDRRLVAYIVANAEDADAGELRTFLARTLPNHMLPAVFVPLAGFPLTPSGKLDRRALPAPALVRDESAAFRAPQGPAEETLARLMADLLGLDRVGADDNFFELGGHSLLAVQFIVRVRQSTGKELSLHSLFQNPTPQSLAELIAVGSNESHISINQSPEERAATIYLRDGSQPPIFCVHPAGGIPTVYRFIASELHTDVPMIGLQARSLNSDVRPHPTIHEMAEDYVRTICGYQRTGPLRILGWSFGGPIAIEMAAILEEMGRPPEHLFLMDSILEASAEDQEMTMSDCLRLFCNIFGFDFHETNAEATKRFLFEEMKTIKIFSESDSAHFFERFLANFMHSANLSKCWAPRKIRTPIAYLRSTDNVSTDLETKLRQVTSGHFEIIDVDAPHLSMCSMTNSKKTAAHLDRLLAVDGA